MDCLNVSDIKIYLPGCAPSKCEAEVSKIPVMTDKSADIFSKICPLIPDTTEKFTSVKKLEISAKEIRASADEIAKLKENETLHKVGSVLAIAALTILATAATVTIIATSILCPFSMALVMGLTVLGTATISILPLGSFSGLWAYDAFTRVPEAQKKLSTKIEETKENHEKFKDYFTTNYKDLKKGIDVDLELHSKNLELMVGMQGEECEALKKKLTDDSKVLEQAHTQLKNLHRFYTQSNRVE